MCEILKIHMSSKRENSLNRQTKCKKQIKCNYDRLNAKNIVISIKFLLTKC